MMTKEVLQKKTIEALTAEAKRAKQELREYLDDLEMYSKTEFWEAIQEAKENKGKRFASVNELMDELDS
jgi:chaperonin cofactor prefoldin